MAYSILFISHYTDLYGANRSMLNLISGLKEEGISDVSVILPANGDVCIELKKKAINFYIIPFVLEVHDYKKPQAYIKRLAKKYYNLFLVVKNRRRFKKQTNLIVHTNTSINFFGAYLAESLNAKHVWHIREFGKEDYNLIYNFGDAYFYKWINKASAVICISKALFNYRFKMHLDVLHQVIYNGIVNCASLKKTVYPAAKNEVFRFGISGHISQQKNQLDAIKAFKLIADKYNCELLIAGTGEEDFLKQLKTLVKEYALENSIKFTGFIINVFEFYASLDCVLVCSKNEALGRTTIEAMSMGLPVIGFNNAGTAEIITDGYNGLLYNEGYTNLAEKMKAVISDYEALSAIRLQAVETVKEKFTIEKYAENVCNIYKKISD